MGITTETESNPSPPGPEQPHYRWRFIPAGPDENGIEQPDRMVFGGTPQQPCIIEISPHQVKEPSQTQLSQFKSPDQIVDLHQALQEAATILLMLNPDQTVPSQISAEIMAAQYVPQPNNN